MISLHKSRRIFRVVVIDWLNSATTIHVVVLGPVNNDQIPIELLDAKVHSPGQVTSEAREIDFFLASCSLSGAIVGCQLRWDTPYSTHATIRLLVRREKDAFMKMVPAVPARLP